MRRGNRTTYTMDALGREVRRLYPNNSRATFAFDQVGNRVQMRDTTGDYEFAYDGMNRMESVSWPGGAPTTYVYDALGQRSELVKGNEGVFTYKYDAAGQVATIANLESLVATKQYDAAGRCVVRQSGNGDRSVGEFDAMDQLVRFENFKADDSSITIFTYGYDPVGRKASILELDGSRVTFGYDAAGRLVAESRTGVSGYDDAFSYDAAANRLEKTSSGNRTTYTYDIANQLKTSADASGTTNYVFDANGNQRITQSPVGQRTTNSWGYENELRGVALPTGLSITYTYNADGVRRARNS